MNSKSDVIIVGAGISGLYAASILVESGKSVRIFDRDSNIGGRIQTEEVGGFLLDKGFQILLPAYEEAKRAFDYEKLELKRFERGARILIDGKWVVVRDPLDAPWQALFSLFSPVGTFHDKLGIAYLQQRAMRGTLEGEEERSTEEYLKHAGFSERMLSQFFRPFFEGVFLEPDLSRSSKEFAFFFSLFAKEGGAVPKAGMRSLPMQLAEKIPNELFSLNEEVESVKGTNVCLASGEEVSADQIILAVNEEALYKLLGSDSPSPKRARGTTCIYFKGPGKLSLPPFLHLLPSSEVGISNIAPLSSLSRSYARSGEALLAVSLTHREEMKTSQIDNLEELVQEELVATFGESYRDLSPIKSYNIPHALPSEKLEEKELSLRPNVHLAGDVSEQGSINGALIAGRRAAERVLGSNSLSGSRN